MENENERVEQVERAETMKALQAETTKNLLTSSKSEGPMGKWSYWIFYKYGYSGFLFWNWTYASC